MRVSILQASMLTLAYKLCIFVRVYTYAMDTPTNDNKLAHILLVYTGGTIGMLENPQTGVLEPLDFAYLQEQLPELQALPCQISVETIEPPIDSSAITPEAWVRIAMIIASAYERYDGFVVLHGTDTMAYTASALSFMFENLAKPVILTGSQLPIGSLRTDGKENLISAIEIAAARSERGTPRVPEVCIFFQNVLLRGNRARKVSTYEFDAFKSSNYPRLAYTGIHTRYNDSFIHQPTNSSAPLGVRTSIETNVAVLKLFPGIGASQVEAILGMQGLKGVVLETFGAGNAPTASWFIEALQRAIDKRIVIINITQCNTGYVDMLRYDTGVRLHRMGVINGQDLTLEAAITKLMLVCGMGLSPGETKQRLESPCRGEMSQTPELEDYSVWERLNQGQLAPTSSALQ